MDTGPMFRRGMEELFGHNAGPVAIHKNWNTPQQRTVTVTALKNNEKGRPSVVFFEFLERLDIQAGDVLQQVGSQNPWRVTRVEDNVMGKGTFVSLRAYASNVDAPVQQQGGNTVNVQGHVYGGLQVGSHNSTQNITVSVSVVDVNVQKLRELLDRSEIPTLEKEDAQEALGRIQDLARRQKSSEGASKMKEKLSVVAQVFTIAKGLNDLATPHMETLGKWIAGG